jgi:hypothetical protein
MLFLMIVVRGIGFAMATPRTGDRKKVHCTAAGGTPVDHRRLPLPDDLFTLILNDSRFRRLAGSTGA